VRENPTVDTLFGKPVSLASRYYEEGADELVFLNITCFWQGMMDDILILQLLEVVSKIVFVPLTVGGGIRSFTNGEGETYSALEVANFYFRTGADKMVTHLSHVYVYLLPRTPA